MKKRLLLIYLPIMTLALEGLPMGTVMYFGNPSGEPHRQTFSYFDPIHWGYADFAPNLTALLTCTLAILAVIGAIRGTKRLGRATVTVAVLAAVFSLLVLWVGFTFIALGVSLLLLLTAVTAVLKERNI